MATTLTVDQAIQRLIQSPPKSTGEGATMTIGSEQNSESNRVVNNSFILNSNGMHSNSIATNSRYGDDEVRRSSADEHSPVNGILLHLSPVHDAQRGRRKSNNDQGNRRIGNTEGDKSGPYRHISSQAADPVVDVQRCLKNIIVSQVNIIKKQQQLLADKDRQIEDLRRENNALRYSMRSQAKSVQTKSFAQQCELSDFDDANPETVKSKSTEDESRIKASVVAGNQDSAMEEGPVVKRRRRTSTDLTVIELNDETLGKDPGLLRSGRRRATLQHDQESSLAKRGSEETVAAELFTPIYSKRSKKCSTSNKDNVQTPGWRVVQPTAGGVLEGTENITDDAFAKRHQKCELEERRVIRRDKMRQREAMLKEKLIRAENQTRKREESDSASSPAPPDITALKSIEIYESIPRAILGKLGYIQSARKRRKYSRK